MREGANYLKEVRDQYEELPYPPRDPQEELKTFWQGDADQLDIVNHYCFEGRKILDKNFRSLVAGGGTGDSVIYLAEQLLDAGAEVIHLDISEASINVCKERARVRKLENIRWIHGSLLDLPLMGLGEFDFINCSGVLHHLADPDAGLRALVSVLKQDGAMALMLYATYGRTGIYHVQNLMRRINGTTAFTRDKISDCKNVLASLPATNWFKRGEELAHDHVTMGDAGIYDLFLHARDRSYTVPEIFEYVEKAGLVFRDFVKDRGRAKLLYSAATNISNPGLLNKVLERPLPEQYAIVELLRGDITRHSFFSSKKPRKVPGPEDTDLVPILSVILRGGNDDAYNVLSALLQTGRGPMIKLNVTPEHWVTVPLNDNTKKIVQFIDGKRSIKETIDAAIDADRAQAKRPATREELMEAFTQLYRALNFFDWMLLKDKAVPDVITVPRIQARMHMRIK